MEREFRIVLVDDESPARNRLRRLIHNLDTSIKIVGEAENGIQAVEMINSMQPDAVFLDIQMPGYDGFEVINKLNEVPRIVFCTAYEEYAVKAFDANGVDYLMKPVKEERLAQAIDKLKINKQVETSPNEVIDVVRQMLDIKQDPELTSLPVKVGDKVVFVALSDVLAFEAEDKYVNVITRRGKTFITDLSLKRLEGRLPTNFVRVHRILLPIY